MLDSAEDPETTLGQLVRDYTATIAEAEQATAQLIGDMRMIEQDQAEDATAVGQWNRNAEAASQKADELRAAGDAAEADKLDGLARIALERQLTAEQDVQTGQHTIDAQGESIEKLTSGLEQMQVKLAELRRKRDELVAAARSAHAPAQLPAATASIDLMDPTSEMRRFEEELRCAEGRTGGGKDLATSSADKQFASLDDPANQAEIDERLQAMKAGRAVASARARAQDQNQPLR